MIVFVTLVVSKYNIDRYNIDRYNANGYYIDI